MSDAQELADALHRRLLAQATPREVIHAALRAADERNDWPTIEALLGLVQDCARLRARIIKGAL